MRTHKTKQNRTEQVCQRQISKYRTKNNQNVISKAQYADVYRFPFLDHQNAKKKKDKSTPPKYKIKPKAQKYSAKIDHRKENMVKRS